MSLLSYASSPVFLNIPIFLSDIIHQNHHSFCELLFFPREVICPCRCCFAVWIILGKLLIVPNMDYSNTNQFGRTISIPLKTWKINRSSAIISIHICNAPEIRNKSAYPNQFGGWPLLLWVSLEGQRYITVASPPPQQKQQLPSSTNITKTELRTLGQIWVLLPSTETSMHMDHMEIQCMCLAFCNAMFCCMTVYHYLLC